MKLLCTTIVTTLALVGTSFAATINVPGDYLLIQDAINASVNGDVINIAAGTYHESNLNPNGKAITIQGTINGDGSWATTIDAQQSGRVFSIDNGEGPNTVIRDVVVRGGYSLNSSGGGFKITSSSPTIENCHIHSNTAINTRGGGLSLNHSNAIISNCLIEDNLATNNRGGGIALWGFEPSFPVISHCKIQNNTVTNGSGGGIFVEEWGNPKWDSNPFIDNSFICGNSPDQIYGPWTDGGNNGIGNNCTFGGCCLDNGASCEILSQSACQNSGGVYLGNGTDCSVDSCNDDDGDGVLNAADAFPNDPAEWADSDGDGYGDNSDEFPNDPSEYQDTDDDGVGDNADPWPNDPAEWADSDGDGVGDNEDQALKAACCVGNGCHPVSEFGCGNLSGTWLGEAGSCDDCVAPPETCDGDINADGVVDIDDLLLLISYFGNTCM